MPFSGIRMRLTRSKPGGAIVEGIRWHNFSEVRSMFTDADYVNGYVVFNFRKNRYRLITVVHYAKTIDRRQTGGHVYIRSFLTHKEYSNPKNWDRRFGTKRGKFSQTPRR
jgi:mRNA interferase HigB